MRSANAVARLLGRFARGCSIAARTVAPVDTNPVPAHWTHVTKVDPEERKKLPLLFPLYLGHTDAVSVGGSDGVTADNTEATVELLAPCSVPTVHEPSGPRHVTRRTREFVDFLAVPEVLNGGSESLVGTLGAGTEYVREELVPELLADELGWLPTTARDALAEFAASWLLADAAFEAYLVQNPDSAAAREAGVTGSDVLSPRAARRRAMAAERHLGSELVYVEYSGTYGGEEAVEVLSAVTDALSWSRLWYGGGLDSRERTEAVLAAGADAVVVGDVFHRIAEEEADVCARAAGDLDAGVSQAAARDWVRDCVDVTDSAAAAYLATVPSVAEPERLAERYLAATVRAWLGARELGADSGDERLADRPWVADVLDGLGADDAAVMRRCLRSFVTTDAGVSTDHFALPLTERD